MSAVCVTISGDTPAEVASRLRGLADALTRPTASVPATNGDSGGLPPVPSSAPPRVCSVHGTPMRFDEWESKAGKACKAWRCPQSTAASGCDIEWAS